MTENLVAEKKQITKETMTTIDSSIGDAKSVHDDVLYPSSIISKIKSKLYQHAVYAGL